MKSGIMQCFERLLVEAAVLMYDLTSARYCSVKRRLAALSTESSMTRQTAYLIG